MDTKEILIQLAKQIRDERELGANTATRVGSLFLAMVEFMGEGEFLHKDKEDVTKFLLECLGGLTVEKGLKADSLEVEGNTCLGGTVEADGLGTFNKGLVAKCPAITNDSVCGALVEDVEDPESNEVATGLIEEVTESSGNTTIGNLANVSNTADSASKGSILVFNGTIWIPMAPASASDTDTINMLVPVFHTTRSQWMFVPGSLFGTSSGEVIPSGYQSFRASNSGFKVKGGGKFYVKQKTT